MSNNFRVLKISNGPNHVYKLDKLFMVLNKLLGLGGLSKFLLENNFSIGKVGTIFFTNIKATCL